MSVNRSGVGNRSYYGMQYVVCPLCNADMAEESRGMFSNFFKGGAAMLSIGFLMVFGIFAFAFYQFRKFTADFPDQPGFNPFDTILPIFIGIMVFGMVAVIGVFVLGSRFMSGNVNKREAQAKQAKREFLRTVENKSFRSQYEDDHKLTCNDCGEMIPTTSRFCMSCGGPTEEERARQYR